MSALDRFLEAAKTGDFKIIKEISETTGNDWIERGTQEYGVRIAAEHGHLEIIQYLAEIKQVNIHANKEDALAFAAMNNQLHVVKYLIEKQRADIFDNNQYATFIATQRGHLKTLKYLIEHAKATDETALSTAIQYEHMHLIKYLVEDHKIDISSDPQPIIYYTAHTGRLDILKYLEKHCDLDLSHGYDHTIKTAIARNKTDITEYFLQEKEHALDLTENWERDILRIIKKDNLPLLHLVIKHGAKFDFLKERHTEIYYNCVDILKEHKEETKKETRRKNKIAFNDNVKEINKVITKKNPTTPVLKRRPRPPS